MTTETLNGNHESYEVHFLDSKEIYFEYAGENLTFVDEDGTYYPRVTLRRGFPLSAGNRHILVRTPETDDEHGVELGIIENVDDLNEKDREAVNRELRLHYFVPVISRIEKIKEEFGFLYWSVDTDRGHKDFIMRDSIIGQVRKVSEGRWLVIDINQTRYEIHNFQSLDSNSQEYLRKYLLL
jgi:hypothetical protein